MRHARWFVGMIVVLLLGTAPWSTQAQAPQMTYGATIGGLVDGQAQWSFEGQQRDVVQLTVRRIGGRFTPRLVLEAPDGSVLQATQEQSDEHMQTLTFRDGLPTDGTYAVRVLEQNSSSDPLLTPSEYSLTLNHLGQRRAATDEGLTPLPSLGATSLPDFFMGEDNGANDLNVSIYGAADAPYKPDANRQFHRFLIESPSVSVSLSNASPIARGIDAFAFTGEGVAFRNTSQGAVFFTDQDITNLAYEQRVTTITLANGQRIVTDFYRIASLQAVDGLLALRTVDGQRVLLRGTDFEFTRQGGIEGEGPNAEPVNVFAVDGNELRTDMAQWHTLAYFLDEGQARVRVLYGADMRFLTNQANLDIYGRGNALRPELDPAGLDTRYTDILVQREDDVLRLELDPTGMGDVLLDEVTVVRRVLGGEAFCDVNPGDVVLAVRPLDGRTSCESFLGVQRLLIENLAVRYEFLDGRHSLLLPDGTFIPTEAALTDDPTALAGQPSFVPRYYNNLGTHIFDHTPDLNVYEALLPVNRVTGNFYYAVQDFHTPSHTVALDWSRSYNSMSPESLTPAYMLDSPTGYWLGSMGQRWRHSYQYELDIRAAPLGRVRLLLPDGSSHLFRATEANRRRFRSAHLLSWTVERVEGETGAWRAFTTEGIVYSFDRAGRLQRITDAEGLSLTFSPAPRQFAEAQGQAGGFFVTEPYGRRLEIYTDANGRVALALDVQTRSIRYEYSTDTLIGVQYVADDQRATYEADDEGRIVWLDDPHSPYHPVMRLRNDSIGRILNLTINPDSPDGSPELETEFRYLDGTQITEEAQSFGDQRRTSIWTFDESFRLLRHDLPREEGDDEWSVRWDYDPETGRIAEYRQANRAVLRFTVDDFGALSSYSDPIFGGAGSYEFSYRTTDSGLRLLERIDYPPVNGQSVYQQFGYDEQNHLVRITRPVRMVPSTETQTETYEYDELGRIVLHSRPGPDGAPIKTEYDYDNYGYVSRISEGNGQRVWTVAYDFAGRLRSIQDGRGTTMALDWDDDSDRIIRVRIADYAIQYAYDARGNLISITELGQAAQGERQPEQYEYNALNQLVSYTDALGNTTRYEYDAPGNLQRVVQPATGDDAPLVTEYTYDVRDNLRSITSPSGLTTQYRTTLDTVGSRTIVTVENPIGEIQRYEYDALGRLRSVVSVDTNGTQTYTYNLTYNALGYLTEIREDHVPGGRTLSMDYDLLGNVLRSTIDDESTEYVYNAAGWLESITGADGRTLQYEYDALGNATQVTLPQGATQQYVYDPNGNLTRFSDALGHVYEFQYDALNRLIRATDALGNTTTYGYDALGNLNRVEDARGNVIQGEYDALNRLVRLVDASGNSTEYNYNALGQLTSMVSPTSLVTSLTYDRDGALVTFNPPETEEFLIGRDSLGRIVSFTNPIGQTTIYSYNTIGRIGRILNPLGNESFFGWSSSGRLVRYIDPGGSEYTYRSDSVGRLEFINDLSLNQTLAVNLQIEYADGGDIEALRLGTSASLAGEGAAEHRYTYNDAGWITSYQAPGLGAPWQFTYDELGRMIAATNPAGQTTRYEYDAVGNITAVLHPTEPESEEVVVERYEYDAVGNVVRYRSPDGLDIEFTYDASNRLIKRREVDTGSGAERTYCFAYDEFGNVAGFSDPNGQYTGYTHDSSGNVLSIERYLSPPPDAALCEDETTAADPVDAESSEAGAQENASASTASVRYSYEYDPINNLLGVSYRDEYFISMSYNLLGQRVRYSVGGSWAYAYNAAGLLAQVSDPLGNSTAYSYDGADRLTQVRYETGAAVDIAYDSGGNLAQVTLPPNATGQRERVEYTLDQTGGLVEIEHGTRTTLRYERDVMGRVIRYTNARGQETTFRYDERGNLIQIDTPEEGVITRSYDELGRLTSVTAPDGNISYAYDAFGNLMSVSTADTTIRYEYDPAGNLLARDSDEYGRVEYRYDAVERLEEIRINDELISIDYDENGRRTSMERGNGVTTEYRYDDEWRIVAIAHNVDGERLDRFNYEYDAMGNIVRIIRQGGSSILYSYDEAQQLISERWLNETGQLIYSVTYSYDLAGNRIEEVTSIDQGNPQRTLYTYNNENQLIAEYRNVPSSTEERLSLTVLIAAAVGLPLLWFVRRRRRYLPLALLIVPLGMPFLQQNAEPNIVYRYDAEGSLRAMEYDTGGGLVFEYDSLQRLVAVSGSTYEGEEVNTTIAYDPQGRIAEVLLFDVQYRFVYGASGLIAINNVTENRETVYYEGFPGEILMWDVNGATQWPLYDALGTVRRVAQADGSLLFPEPAGYDFNAFGERLAPFGEDQVYYADAEAQAPQPLYNDLLSDPHSGLYWLGMRAYDPRLGRYVQRDPVRHDPRGNLYTYAYNRPNTYRDPDGLRPQLAFEGVPPAVPNLDALLHVPTPLLPAVPQPDSVRERQTAENARMLRVAQEARYGMNAFAGVLDPALCDFSVHLAHPLPDASREIMRDSSAHLLGHYSQANGWRPASAPDVVQRPDPQAAFAPGLALLRTSGTNPYPLQGCPDVVTLPHAPQVTGSSAAFTARADFRALLEEVPLFPALVEQVPMLQDRGLLQTPELTLPGDGNLIPPTIPPLAGQVGELQAQTEAFVREAYLPRVLPDTATETRTRNVLPLPAVPLP